MRILILSYIFAPDLSPRAYRWTALARRWAEQGHQVTVISGWKAGDLRYQDLDAIRVHRVGGGLIERLKGWLGQRTHGAAPGIGDHHQVRPAKRWVLRVAKWVHDHLWASLRWPDYAAPWIVPAVLMARTLLASQGADVLISVSHPFSGHVAALALQPARRKLPWLADSGDPFSRLPGVAINNRWLFGGLNAAVERRMLAQADGLAVTHAGCARHLTELYPACAPRMEVIGPLLSLPQPALPQCLPAAFHQDGWHLVFLGTLYSRLRSPKPLLEVVEAMVVAGDDVHLHLCGSLNDCADMVDSYAHRLGGRLHFHGMLPRDVAAAAMRAANGLVNLGNDSDSQIPSKLVEYMASGRPILNLTASAVDVGAGFLGDYPMALSVSACDASTAANLEQIRRLLRMKPLTTPSTARFGLESIGMAYDDLLAKIIATRQTKQS